MQIARPMSLAIAIAASVGIIFSSQTHARNTDDLSRPIVVSDDGRLLTQPDGSPFFWLGDTAWELFHRLTREEADTYLQTRARQGFNIVQAVATGKIDAVGLDAPNRYGETPFIDRDPARPNPKYFAHVDWVIERAARYGIRFALLPTWGNTLVSGSEDEDGFTSRVFDASNAEAYGRWLGHRYRQKGIVWVLGGDVNPLWPHRPTVSNVDYRPIYRAMARGIAAGTGNAAFITYHPSAGSHPGTAIPLMSLYFPDESWVDMRTFQSGGYLDGAPGPLGGYYQNGTFYWHAFRTYEPVAHEYRSTPARPVINSEPRYEGQGYQGQDWPSHRVRLQLYHALFSGAAGHTYGHMNVWNFYDAARFGLPPAGRYDRVMREGIEQGKHTPIPWQSALDADGASQMRHARDLLLSRPYFSRIPDQSLVIGDNEQGERHLVAMRSRDGSFAMIYIPQGQEVTVNMAALAGPSAVGWWFNPRTGRATRIDTSLSTHGPMSFRPPSSGEDQDWILVLDDASREFPPPGERLPLTARHEAVER